MTLETVTLRLPRALLSDAQRLASKRGTSIGELLRTYLETEVSKPPETQEARAIRLTAPLFETAPDWDSLITALRVAGFALKPHGMGLALYDAHRDAYICNTAKAGFKYRKLVKRFRVPMPGHAHGDKWLPQQATQNPTFEVLE